MSDAAHIRQLRERLVAARRRNDRAALSGLIEGLQSLAGRGYRCCLVDFDACRPAYYVRVLGFEDARVTAELEFPIEPRLRTVQHVPLSHLVEYEEAEPSRIRKIYENMAPFLHDRRLALAPERPPRLGQAPRGRADGKHPRRTRPGATAVWWAIAGLLFVTSLTVFIVA